MNTYYGSVQDRKKSEHTDIEPVTITTFASSAHMHAPYKTPLASPAITIVKHSD